MGMGMSSMSSEVREHVQKEITDLKTMINNEITGLRTEINNDNAETYAGLLKAVDDKIATLSEKMSLQVQMKATPRMINEITEPLREELKKLKDRNSKLQQTELTDKDSLLILKDHMNEIQRKFEHHVTHADVKELEARVTELEALTAPTRGMGPATLRKNTREDDYGESAPTRGMGPATLRKETTEEDHSESSPSPAERIRDARGAKTSVRGLKSWENYEQNGKRRMQGHSLSTITESQANKNPYLLLLE